LTGQGGQATTAGGTGTGGSQGAGTSGSGSGQGGGTNQASGSGKGFGPAPQIMTPLGLISQALIGWSLLLLIILLALLLALDYSRRPEAGTTARATAQQHSQ
jgi:hypothetical protein